jgi:hypothetical protein
MDERHRETREQIRNIYNNGSIDHFVGGALGKLFFDILMELNN